VPNYDTQLLFGPIARVYEKHWVKRLDDEKRKWEKSMAKRRPPPTPAALSYPAANNAHNGRLPQARYGWGRPILPRLKADNLLDRRHAFWQWLMLRNPFNNEKA
jgi:hypothetical protein